MAKARKTSEDLLQPISRQTKRSIRSAGPRYTPNVAPGAPNLAVEMISSAFAALSATREWKSERAKQAERVTHAFRGLVHLSAGPSRAGRLHAAMSRTVKQLREAIAGVSRAQLIDELSRRRISMAQVTLAELEEEIDRE